MSVETELWTREGSELASLLPRADEWNAFVKGVFEFEGDGWLLTVSEPQIVAPDEIPSEIAGLVSGLRFRVELGVEPSGAPPDAWEFVREVMERLGSALQGAGHDPESGHALSWAS